MKRPMQDLDKAIPHSKIAATTQARLAAESAFTQVATPALVGSPVVVVKRRKVVLDSEAGDGSHGSAEEGHAARSPKIHRMEPNLLGVLGEGVERGAPATDVRESSQARDDEAPTGSERRRRQKRHGQVTIIRPERPSASELAEFRREAMERHERLMAEIRKVDRQAEAVRKAEAAKVVRWIRKAIADYGLDADDLGL